MTLPASHFGKDGLDPAADVGGRGGGELTAPPSFVLSFLAHCLQMTRGRASVRAPDEQGLRHSLELATRPRNSDTSHKLASIVL